MKWKKRLAEIEGLARRELRAALVQMRADISVAIAVVDKME